jgi:hypothetical protein
VVVPLGSSEVPNLVHHCLEPIVYSLWLLSIVEHEPSLFSLDHLPFGDLGDMITFMRHLEHVGGMYLSCTSATQ